MKMDIFLLCAKQSACLWTCRFFSPQVILNCFFLPLAIKCFMTNKHFSHTSFMNADSVTIACWVRVFHFRSLVLWSLVMCVVPYQGSFFPEWSQLSIHFRLRGFLDPSPCWASFFFISVLSTIPMVPWDIPRNIFPNQSTHYVWPFVTLVLIMKY